MMREAFAATMSDLLDEEPRAALVLADISADLFTQAAARHPKRVINVGIREQLAVNVGAGLALAGMRPVVHTFAPFLVERGFEQVKLGFGHQDVGGVLVSAGASFDYAASGRTHQAPEDVALMNALPGWTIHVPGHADEVRALLPDAVRGGDRVYLRTSSQSNREAYPVGGLHVVRRGTRGTVLAVGPVLDAAVAAVSDLDLTVLYASTVRPFDAATLLATLSEPDVVVVEPLLAGTSVGVVGEALGQVRHRVLGLGVPRAEFRRYGTAGEHAAAHGLDAAGIHEQVVRFLDG